MLFNSHVFLFAFLPITVAGYFALLHSDRTGAAKLWLAVASLFFYAYWNVLYLPLLLGSILFNFAIARVLSGALPRLAPWRTPVYVFGIAANLTLLGWFKYTDFLIENVDRALGLGWEPLRLALPLGISFITFQKIAYLTDIWRGLVRTRNFIDYLLFVSFFPQLIAGPIVHHAEVIPQFERARGRSLDWRNLSLGLFVLAIGLAKKVLVADSLAGWATHGFDEASTLTFFEAWGVSLAYTAQLYFDFSGYCDMAMGAALMFNIRLPANFDSPYRSLDLQDFWRRWHITLGRFLREYVYIPLGGNRGGEARTRANLLATFLIGGLWHGAAWTFVFWGFLHGAGLVVHRVWSRAGFRLPRLAAWAVTFLFVHVAWVFFRAKDWGAAWKVLRGMAGLDGFVLHGALAGPLGFLAPLGVRFGEWRGLPDSSTAIPAIAASLLLAFLGKNSLRWMEDFRLERRFQVATAVLALAAILSLNRVSEFLYFQF
jgi:D-alanyl-lipoteichoic acid acyltransferase DltB (MBOAT superfamily)